MKRIVVMVILTTLSFLLSACSGKTTLQYTIQGKAEQVDIHYTDNLGNTRDMQVKPPFTLEFETGKKGSFQIYASNVTGQGDVSCEVLANGQSLGSAHGTEFAGCEGTYERQGGNVNTHFTAYDNVLPKGFTLPKPPATPTVVVAQAIPEQTDLGGAFIMALGNSENGMALYLFDTSSGEIVQWTEPLGYLGCADWSPVEPRLIFNSGNTGDVHLYLLSFDGNKPGPPVNLSRSPGGDGCPDWSPDGKFIAFDAKVPVGHNILYMNPIGLGLPLRGALTRGDKYVNTHPDWSPDGKSVIYKTSGSNMASIQLVTLSNDEPVTLIESKTDFFASPVWSPDGGQIAFVKDVKGPEASVYVMDANGENVKPVTTQPFNFIESVAWSPDGTRLVFNAIEEKVGYREIYMIDVDGSHLTHLAGLPDVDLSELRFVPDGYITKLPAQPISIQP